MTFRTPTSVIDLEWREADSIWDAVARARYEIPYANISYRLRVERSRQYLGRGGPGQRSRMPTSVIAIEWREADSIWGGEGRTRSEIPYANISYRHKNGEKQTVLGEGRR